MKAVVKASPVQRTSRLSYLVQMTLAVLSMLGVLDDLLLVFADNILVIGLLLGLVVLMLAGPIGLKKIAMTIVSILIMVDDFSGIGILDNWVAAILLAIVTRNIHADYKNQV